MNYEKIYNDIILRAKSEDRVKFEGVYYENHHITPKCLGGLDSEENMILLIAREHFICHKLLIKIYPEKKGLIYAVFMMISMKGTNQSRDYRVGSREYERIKREMAIQASKNSTGRKPSLETIEKLRLINTGHIVSEESREKIRIGNTGKIESVETRNKKSESGKAKAPASKETNKKISESHIGYKYKIVICPYCDKPVAENAIKRYHGDNCKQNPNYVPKEKKIIEKKSIVCPHCDQIGTSLGMMNKYHFDNCYFKPIININYDED